MDIFFLDKSKFLSNINPTSLETFSDNRKYLSCEKYTEHLLGLFITKFIAKNYFGINCTDIKFEGKKPIFKNSDLNFSISHSENIVLCAFNSNNIGADIEYMRDRNFKQLAARYNISSGNISKEDFYKFWTSYEAGIKLGKQIKSKFCTIIEDNYMLSCVSDAELVSDFKINKLQINDKNVDLTEEYSNPKCCKIINL